jgi:hypothetical protein
MAGPIFPLYGGRISMAQVSYDLNFWDYWYFFCIKSKIHHCRGKDMKHNRNRKHFSRNMIFLRIFLLKGTVACNFCPLVFFSNRPHLGPCLLHYIFSNYVQLYRVIRIQNSYCAMGHCGEPDFFGRYQGFKTWVM